MQGYIWLTIWWQGCVYAPENDDKPLDFDVAHFQTNQFLLSGEKKTIQPIQPFWSASSQAKLGFK
jgi:hypothetical protein